MQGWKPSKPSRNDEVNQRLAHIFRGAFVGPPTPLKDIPTREGESRRIRKRLNHPLLLHPAGKSGNRVRGLPSPPLTASTARSPSGTCRVAWRESNSRFRFGRADDVDDLMRIAKLSVNPGYRLSAASEVIC